MTDCAPIRSFEIFGKDITKAQAHFEVLLKVQTINETNEYDTILPMDEVSFTNTYTIVYNKSPGVQG